MAELLPFRNARLYTECRVLRSDDGRKWDARIYLPDSHHDMKPGKRYTISELARFYGLPTDRHGIPYLHPHAEGDPMPEEVEFVVEPIG